MLKKLVAVDELLATDRARHLQRLGAETEFATFLLHSVFLGVSFLGGRLGGAADHERTRVRRRMDEGERWTP